jgi:hypothetical protein
VLNENRDNPNTNKNRILFTGIYRFGRETKVHVHHQFDNYCTETEQLSFDSILMPLNQDILPKQSSFHLITIVLKECICLLDERSAYIKELLLPKFSSRAKLLLCSVRSSPLTK